MVLLILVAGGLIVWAISLLRSGSRGKRWAGIAIVSLLVALAVAFPFFITYANSTEPQPVLED
jgi:hypothetical protein